MGMFDNVRCECPVPDGYAGRDFQTKDLGCQLDRYTITRNGRLMRMYVSGQEPVPESEWKYVGSDDPLRQIWHEQSKWKNIYSECDMNFHGWLRFYACKGSQKNGTWEWHEYKAKFTDGQLVEIVVVKDTGCM